MFSRRDTESSKIEGKPLWKISYKVMKEEYGYDTFLVIYSIKTLIQLKDFLSGIHQCVTFFGKWIFDSNLLFLLPLTKDNLDYCFINDHENKMNGYKGLLKTMMFFKNENNKSVIQEKKIITCV